MVLKNLLLYAALVALVLTASCKEEIDTNPPESPYLRPHTAETDTLPVEVGTDAKPECQCILVEWIPNTEEDLKEYEIFRSSNPTSGFISLTIRPAGESTYTDDNVLLTKYYYYIKARDQSGNTSEPSTKVDYELTAKAVPTSPAKWDTVFTDSARFEWTWEGGLEGAFLVKLYSDSDDSTCWMGWTNAYDTLRAYSPSLPVGDYKWRVDYIGDVTFSENKGSESKEVPFFKR